MTEPLGVVARRIRLRRLSLLSDVTLLKGAPSTPRAAAMARSCSSLMRSSVTPLTMVPSRQRETSALGSVGDAGIVRPPAIGRAEPEASIMKLTMLTAAAVLALTPAAFAASETYTADLKAASEVPAVDSKGSGTLTATY